jgi:hypothetical protein
LDVGGFTISLVRSWLDHLAGWSWRLVPVNLGSRSRHRAPPQSVAACKSAASHHAPNVHPSQTAEERMAEHNANRDSAISDSLHPIVNMAIIGWVLMFVAAVWMFFASDPYAERGGREGPRPS